MKRYILVGLFYISVFYLNGQPILDQSFDVQGLKVYPDITLSNVYYYAPNSLSLNVGQDGKPDFKLTMIRYTGTALTSNQGTKRFNNIAQFKIVMKNMDTKILESVQARLSKKSKITLLPLKIKRIETQLIYTEINPEGLKQNNKNLESGIFETTQDKSPNENTYWTERYYTIRLSNESAQLLEKTLEKGQTIIGFNYVFMTEGVSKKQREVNIQTNRPEHEQVQAIKEQIKADTLIAKLDNYPIFSDAFQVLIDTKKYSDLIQKIDLNAERLPADYAALEVRCYDFNNSIRKDLDAKRIEIEAEGINRSALVSQRFTFSNLHSDIYVKNIKFPYIVRTDRPFRYRLVEILKTGGQPKVSAWIEQKNWDVLLDITSR